MGTLILVDFFFVWLATIVIYSKVFTEDNSVLSVSLFSLIYLPVIPLDLYHSYDITDLKIETVKVEEIQEIRVDH